MSTGERRVLCLSTCSTNAITAIRPKPSAQREEMAWPAVFHSYTQSPASKCHAAGMSAVVGVNRSVLFL